VARVARTGVRTTRTPSAANTASNAGANIAARSRTSTVGHLPVAAKSQHTFRAVPNSLNVAHLRAMLEEYVTYYNTERPYRGLGLAPPRPRAGPPGGPVRALPVLGGLHHIYKRAAR
jgi:transposase InsO family protein